MPTRFKGEAMMRFALRLVLTIFVAGFVGSARVGQLAWAGDSAKCTIATSGKTEPARACAKGGRPEAKKTMKRMVESAKAKGQKQFSCSGCHKDLENFELTKDARDELKKLEAVLAKK
jgi:hypothetical protein